MPPAKNSNHSNWLLLGLLLSLAGCMSTKIGSQPIKPKVFELAALNRNPIKLVVSAPADASLGHQYLLIALPFGQVEASDLALMAQRAAYQKLALQGFTPVVGDERRPPIGSAMLSPQWIAAPPALNISVEQASASALDFLVTRRLSCSLELKTELSRSGIAQTVASSGSFIHFGAFAFEQELSLCLARALDGALDNAFRDLRIQG